jgi:hypothetical protein
LIPGSSPSPLRDDGQQNGVIVRLEEGQAGASGRCSGKRSGLFWNQMPSMEGLDLTPEVGTEETVVINAEGHPHFAPGGLRGQDEHRPGADQDRLQGLGDSGH